MENLKRVENCLRSVRKISADIQPNSLVLQNLLFESIDVVDLLFMLEQEFGGTLTMLEFSNYVVSKVKERKSKSWDFTVAELLQFVEARI